MTNPADIARALSEAQRRIVLKLPMPGYKCDGRSSPSLWQLGLIDDEWSDELRCLAYVLTPLGLAVRDYLLHRPTSDASTDRNQATVGGCGKGIE